jgi:dihydroorotate dehydrogenase electron transfer subunit
VTGHVTSELAGQVARQTARQVTARVLSNEPAGAYRHLVLAAPGVGEAARPGQFVALSVGGSPTAMLLRRSFSLFTATGEGADGPTVEIVVADAGPGSRWVTRRRPGDEVDLLGPLGQPFPAASGAAPIVMVGGGYGSAPLLWWAREQTAAGRAVEVVLGAASRDRLFGVEQAEKTGARVHVTTDDGSAGTPGRVTTVLPEVLAGCGARDVYACGPMAMLRAVHEAAQAAGVRSWLAVEESMACGIGVCMTCVLPVRHPDGVTRMTRSCVEGPTFAGEAVRWDAVLSGPHGTTSRVPDDCLGSPTAGGH